MRSVDVTCPAQQDCRARTSSILVSPSFRATARRVDRVTPLTSAALSAAAHHNGRPHEHRMPYRVARTHERCLQTYAFPGRTRGDCHGRPLVLIEPQVAFDHACASDRIRVIRSEGTRVDLDVCGLVRRYTAFAD